MITFVPVLFKACVFVILKMHVSSISHLQLHQKKEEKNQTKSSSTPITHILTFATVAKCQACPGVENFSTKIVVSFSFLMHFIFISTIL